MMKLPHMLIRNLLRWIAAGAAMVCSCLGAAEKDSPPNVVLIYADDLGYGDVGCYGATKVKTPNIDKLAAQGRRFTDAHVTSAVCTPSRYSLLTGEYAFRRNCYGPIFLRDGLVMDETKLTLAGLFQKFGYRTACIGKWHLGFGRNSPDWNGELKPGPLEVGFDHYFGVPVVNSHPPFVYVEDHRVVGFDPDDPFVFGQLAETRPFPEKLDIRAIGGAKAAHALYRDEEVGANLTEKAVQWLRRNKDERFFLYFATTAIHHPFTPAPRFKGTSGCGPYGDFIHELDWSVGEILKTLDELSLANDTIVVFTSDNGGMLNDGGRKAWQAGHRMNGGLLGFKFDVWEGGHRVPFIVRWPGKVPAGGRSDQLIANVDMLATMAAVLGYELKEGEAPDSLNVLECMTGDPAAAPRDHLVIAGRQGAPWLMLRKGKWVYIPNRGSGGFADNRGGPAALKLTGETNSDIKDGRILKDAPPAQLYDLEADIGQGTNLFSKHPEIAAEMDAMLRNCIRQGSGNTGHR